MNADNRPLTKYIPKLHRIIPLPALALASVMSRDGMAVYASSDTMFKGAIFGRDSLEVADDIMDIKPALVHNILLTLGRLQGIENRTENEEQVGKIVHEYRTTTLDGRPIDATSQQIFTKLAEKWGGTETELAYYGSIDSTPHFLRTLGRYCAQYGQEILNEKVTRRDGSTVTMRRVAEYATAWLVAELQNSRSGLLEFQMAHALGTPNQAWKDSEEAYVHKNGEMANHDAPIASIEVQGIVYDALISASIYFSDDSAVLRRQAVTVSQKTIELLWMPEQAYFALGLDYDQLGNVRIIRTITANPAALLDTGLFDAVSGDKREAYITAIARRITARDFLTSAGIRSRSLDMAHTVPFWDYHGSYVTWPKETYDIAKGLKRQGFVKLARQLENRLLNLVLKTRSYPEFVYVDEWGRILVGEPTKQRHGGVVLVEGYDKPEQVQAWTVSAMMAIMAGRGQLRARQIERQPWQTALDDAIYTKMPHVDAMLNPLKLYMQYPTHKYHLTQVKDTRTV